MSPAMSTDNLTLDDVKDIIEEAMNDQAKDDEEKAVAFGMRLTLKRAMSFNETTDVMVEIYEKFKKYWDEVPHTISEVDKNCLELVMTALPLFLTDVRLFHISATSLGLWDATLMELCAKTQMRMGAAMSELEKATGLDLHTEDPHRSLPETIKYLVARGMIRHVDDRGTPQVLG